MKIFTEKDFENIWPKKEKKVITTMSAYVLMKGDKLVFATLDHKERNRVHRFMLKNEVEDLTRYWIGGLLRHPYDNCETIMVFAFTYNDSIHFIHAAVYSEPVRDDEEIFLGLLRQSTSVEMSVFDDKYTYKQKKRVDGSDEESEGGEDGSDGESEDDGIDYDSLIDPPALLELSAPLDQIQWKSLSLDGEELNRLKKDWEKENK